MPLDEVLRILREHREEIAGFGVTSLSVFGSVARSEAGPGSDVDLLVEFGVPVGLFQLLKFIELEQHLSDLFGVKVDLVMRSALKPAIGRRILKEVQPI